MAQAVSKSHSFVIRLWEEERESQDEKESWRGYIQHVLSLERKHLDEQTLEAAVLFIRQCIKSKKSGLNDTNESV